MVSSLALFGHLLTAAMSPLPTNPPLFQAGQALQPDHVNAAQAVITAWWPIRSQGQKNFISGKQCAVPLVFYGLVKDNVSSSRTLLWKKKQNWG